MCIMSIANTAFCFHFWAVSFLYLTCGVFLLKNYIELTKDFSTFIKIIFCLLFFILPMWFTTFIYLFIHSFFYLFILTVEHLLGKISVVRSNLFGVMFDSVCCCFVENSCIYVHQGYHFLFFFLCYVFDCGISNAGLMRRIQEHSVLFNILEYLERVGVSSPLNVLSSLVVRSSGLTFGRRLSLTASILLWSCSHSLCLFVYSWWSIYSQSILLVF